MICDQPKQKLVAECYSCPDTLYNTWPAVLAQHKAFECVTVRRDSRTKSLDVVVSRGASKVGVSARRVRANPRSLSIAFRDRSNNRALALEIEAILVNHGLLDDPISLSERGNARSHRRA